MHEKILLVDDDVSILLLVSDVLEEKGLEVTAVRSGEEALRRVEEGRFDLILLDIMMKGLSGLEVCRQIRGRVDCPILFLSAKDSVKDIVKGLDLGADDYLVKPFAFEELLARIRAALRKRRLDRAGEMSIPDGRADDDGLVALEDARKVRMDEEHAVLLDHVVDHNEAPPVRPVGATRKEPIAEQSLERVCGLRGGGGLRLHGATLGVERLARA